MILKLMPRAAGAVAAVSLLLSAGAHAAGPYDAIYAFGDSLSDVGNDYSLTGGLEPASPPYFNGQFSNGNVWLQTLAGELGVAPLTASRNGGTDYAYGGAQSGSIASGSITYTANISDVIGGGGQIAQFQAAHATADPNALYTIWIGSNDIDHVIIADGASPTQAQALLIQTAANIDAAIEALAGEGARNFLLMSIPDLGKTPVAIAQGAPTASAASALAAELNGLVLAGNSTAGLQSLAQLAAGDGLTISVFDSYAFLDQILADPSAYGFSDVTDPCLVGTTVCSNPSAHLFWDAIHPTAPAHVLLGDGAAAALPATVPLPAAVWLMISGLGGVGVIARRRKLV